MHSTAYDSPMSLGDIASDMDVSITKLSRWLNIHDTLRFPADMISIFMEVTNDYQILDALAEPSREVRLKEINLADVADRIVAAHEATAKEYAELVTAIKALDGNGKK